MIILGYHFDIVSLVAGFAVGALFVSALGHFRPPENK